MRAVYVTMLLAAGTVAVAAQPEIPAEIQVPAGEKLVLKAHATGAQIYVCNAHADGGPQWQLKAPDAQLHNAKGAVIGQHYAGPTWKHKDGSEVTAKASAHVDSPDANAIPWLLLEATGHTGAGRFAKVSHIQRLNTQGGKPPAAGGCTADHDGAESKSPYTADYYFFMTLK
jgi:hypothetical protein